MVDYFLFTGFGERFISGTTKREVIWFNIILLQIFLFTGCSVLEKSFVPDIRMAFFVEQEPNRGEAVVELLPAAADPCARRDHEYHHHHQRQQQRPRLDGIGARAAVRLLRRGGHG